MKRSFPPLNFRTKASAFKTAKALILIAGFAWTCHAGTTPSDDVTFTTLYDGTTLPNAATPKWALLYATGTAGVTSGILTMNTPLTGGRAYQINDTATWNGDSGTGTPGSTVEFSLKVIAAAVGAQSGVTMLSFSTGTKAYNFYFSETGIAAGTGTSSQTFDFDTTADFTTYRITLSGNNGGLASLYINHSATPAIANFAGINAATNLIYFGDPSNGVGGEAQWEYVAFTNAGSYAPVPEPKLLGLMGLGLLALFQIGRRKTEC